MNTIFQKCDYTFKTSRYLSHCSICRETRLTPGDVTSQPSFFVIPFLCWTHEAVCAGLGSYTGTQWDVTDNSCCAACSPWQIFFPQCILNKVPLSCNSRHERFQDCLNLASALPPTHARLFPTLFLFEVISEYAFCSCH